MSMSNASSRSASQRSSASRGSQSAGSSISQTSKKSRRASSTKKKKKKLKQVKEGSPFEEDNLIELLQDEVKLTVDDQNSVKDIMDALVFFSQIEASTQLHELVEKLMKANAACQKLRTVE